METMKGKKGSKETVAKTMFDVSKEMVTSPAVGVRIKTLNADGTIFFNNDK